MGRSLQAGFQFDCQFKFWGILNFQELSSKFQGAVLPEFVRLVQSGDPGMARVTGAVKDVIDASDGSVDTVITRMESHMRCIIMEMDVGSNLPSLFLKQWWP